MTHPIIQQIQEKTAKIKELQDKADRGAFKSYGAAIALQRLILERRALRGLLGPLKLVSEGVSCGDCTHRKLDVDNLEFCDLHSILCTYSRQDDSKCGQLATSFEKREL